MLFTSKQASEGKEGKLMVRWSGIRSLYVWSIKSYRAECDTDVSGLEQDSLQAFASSIAGLLSSRAVLEGTSVQ